MKHDDSCALSQAPRSEIWNLLREITGKAEPESQLRGFSLRLGDGSPWWIAGFPPDDSWTEKLAGIMQMHPGKHHGSNLIIFLTGRTPPERVKRLAPPGSGWLVETKDFLKVRFWYRKDSPDLLVEVDSPVAAIEGYTNLKLALQFIYRQSIYRGALPFHAALAEHQGRGVLLAAPSNTGKSTCCRRLPPPWLARCDDEALVTLSPEGRYLAHPFPTWSEYIAKRKPAYTTQDASTLAGVFFFQQAPADECLPLGPSEAVVEAMISAQVAMSRFLWYCTPEEGRQIRTAIFENAVALFNQVPAFRLRVSLTGRFWELLEAALECG
uniref:SynChlorMet cassette protein ScmC n=1 Tax=Desulfobacca acetoxidans TaxID=60893 RepID=A0A7C3V590_9BACT